MAVTRYPLASPIGERSPAAGKDPLLKNCFKETIQEGGEATTYVTKRWGLKAKQSTATAAGRGIWTWKENVYAVVGNTVYKDGVANGTTLSTSTGRVTFAEAADGSGLLLIQDKSFIYTINTSNTLTKLTDADIPTTMMPGIAVLDQYAMVMDTNGAIHSSAVGDVTTWNLDVVTAEVQADPGVGLSRYINYMVAFGEDTLEFFYDAANSSGSPLTRFEGMATLVGCAAGDTITLADQKLLFVARSQHGGRFVGLIEEGFQVTRISTNAIDEILDKEGSNISNAYAYHIRKGGKNLYVLTLPTTAKRTFVADLEEKEWYEWSSDVSGTETYFTCIGATADKGTVYLLDEDNGKYYEFDPETYQDNSGAAAEDILVKIVTKKFDGGALQNKFMYRLGVIGDQPGSSANISIAWSDDDYQTWSTDRTVDLNSSQTWLTRCGMFKRRAFRLKFTANTAMRLEALEGNVVQGSYARSG